MLVARAVATKEKDNNDGEVAAGPRKKRKRKPLMTEYDMDRFVYFYVRGRADAAADILRAIKRTNDAEVDATMPCPESVIPKPPANPPPARLLEYTGQ